MVLFESEGASAESVMNWIVASSTSSLPLSTLLLLSPSAIITEAAMGLGIVAAPPSSSSSTASSSWTLLVHFRLGPKHHSP
jgi:hypothetical protein